MTVAPGTRIGPYEITAKLGEGGMGEVYRATDTKLKREVAIKVLPAAFVEDQERLARFEREAQLLAQLHHPHIASIFGLEESNGIRALIMELVEGEDLSTRIARGPLPLDEALAIAKQITEALEAAHERGIVHRDLKPQNVKLAADGTVKVLDFGLAKAMDADASAAPGSSPATSPTLMNSPTLTSVAIAGGTQLGVILGTAAYMAPEQARGSAVDKRADIWSFGVLLLEMLSGRSPFLADTVPDTLAAVLTREVDPTALPASVPAAIRALVGRCLERNPKNRLRDIGDARIALAEAIAMPPSPTRESVTMPHSGGGWRRALPWVVTAAALAFGSWALWRGQLRGQRGGPTGSGAGEVTQVELSLPPGVDLVTHISAGLGLSPDGRSIAMIGFRGGQRRLYIRRLDEPVASEVKTSSGVNAVAFSPDGQSLVFVAGSAQVVRLSLADQQSAVLASGADLRNSLGWGESGIYYLRAGEIWRVPAAGGESVQLTHLDSARHEVLHSDPVEVPGARRLLFASLTGEAETSRIESVALDGGARAVVVEHASTPAFAGTGQVLGQVLGHVLFERDGAVWAAPFDSARVVVSGQAVEVLRASTFASLVYGSLAYRVSSSGTLAYMPPEFDDKRVLSVRRDGGERALDLPPGPYGMPRVSADGRRLLLEDAQTLEVLDFERGTRSQIARGTFGTSFPNWSADGQRILFRRFNVPVWVATDGSGRGGAIPSATINDYIGARGPDADSVLVGRIQPKTAGDLFLMSISGAFPPRQLLATPAYEGAAELSPDLRWVVYQSNASGAPEIYIGRYPALERAWQVSEGGGAQPHWSRNGAEIYYRGGGKMMAATFDGSAGEPRLGRPTALFVDEYDFGPGISSPNYDVTSDGGFILLRRSQASGRLHLVLNWSDELRRIIAAGGVH
ncbi:MAG: protein kinase [Acidobacteriota bacterium]